MLYMLSQKPQVLKRLRQEILDRVGSSARPTHEDMRDLKYLRATINGTPHKGVHHMDCRNDHISLQKPLDYSLLCNFFPLCFPLGSWFLRFHRPFNFRNATQDATWPAPAGGQPFFIPAGTRCLYSVFLMHRRTDLWGPDGNRCILCLRSMG